MVTVVVMVVWLGERERKCTERKKQRGDCAIVVSLQQLHYQTGSGVSLSHKCTGLVHLFNRSAPALCTYSIGLRSELEFGELLESDIEILEPFGLNRRIFHHERRPS